MPDTEDEANDTAAPADLKVDVHTWRPDPGDVVPADGRPAHGGLARKP
jgi:hypothetical protein